MIAYKCAFDVQREGEMYIKQPYSVASFQKVFFYIFFLFPSQISTITIVDCLGYLYESFTLKPEPNEFPFATHFKAINWKEDKCTLFRSEQEWKLYV